MLWGGAQGPAADGRPPHGGTGMGNNEDRKAGRSVAVPIMEETAEVEIRRRAMGTVRVHTRVREDAVEIDEPLERVEVEVERVPVGRWVDSVPEDRQEGDTTVIPVVEEVVVKRLRLVEEVRVTRSTTTRRHQERVGLRRTEVEVKRTPADPEG